MLEESHPPPSAFTKIKAGGHSPGANANRCPLVLQQCILRCNHFKVTCNSLAIDCRQVQRTLRRLDRKVLLVGFVCENPQRGKVVFNVLKRCQNILSIRCDRGVVGRFSFRDNCPAATLIENSFN